MSYVLAGALVVFIVAIAVTLLVLSARRHGGRQPRASADASYGAGVPGGGMAIVAADPDSPLGDTQEHAGHQRDGETVSDQDAERSGGSGRAVSSGSAGTPGVGEAGERRRRPEDSSHVARPVVGGEGEGLRRI
ncbi:MAG: hypothetical protein H0W14_03155 [Actinobacteria bacterium]|nr:hypothetical protein [Actinomycetota bacterium]